MSEVVLLTRTHEDQIHRFAKDFIEDHKWAKLLVELCSNPEHGNGQLDKLETEDQVLFFMTLTRMDSFKKKYKMPNGQDLTNEQLVYSIFMMLSRNEKERRSALEEAQKFIEQEQKNHSS
jgi:hypothetical protein